MVPGPGVIEMEWIKSLQKIQYKPFEMMSFLHVIVLGAQIPILGGGGA